MLKVIGAGYSRTGTKSLQRALEILDIGRCYHFTEVLKRRHTNDWLEILNGTAPNWERMFKGYSATVDWPTVSFYKQLADHYPDAKVILTIRDPDAWHASLVNGLLPLRNSLPAWIPWTSRIRQLVDRTIWDATFDARARDRDFAVAKFAQHSENVHHSIATDRLLVFDVREGWEPLCRFLERPVPSTPFPKTNARISLRVAAWGIHLANYLLVAGLALAALQVIAAVL